MKPVFKSEAGMPGISLPGEPVDLVAEARRARRRLYPVTVLYSGYAVAVLGVALRAASTPLVPLASGLLGVAIWTLIEYLAHRHVLHGLFPDGPGILEHFAHVRFDSLHTEHHARPWDGNHINGTLRDTLHYMLVFAGASYLGPLTVTPVLWAGVMQAYVLEEWIHHSVHFRSVYRLQGRYWDYITRHHLYHHSPRGSEVAYGLTSGFWDAVLATRIPAGDRRLLYARRAR